MSPVGLAQLTVFEADLERGGHRSRGLVPALDHYLEIIRRDASIELDFLGMMFTPQERHGEPRFIDLLLELLSRDPADHILLSQD